MARCGKCGQVMEANARFCSACGQPLAPTPTVAPSASPVSMAQSPNSNKRWLWVGLGVMALIALAFVLGTQSGFFARAQVKPEEAPSILQAEAPPQAPSILQAEPPPPAPSILQGEAPQPKQVPQHVLDWLEHLKRIEQKRQAMERNFNPAVDMLKDALAMRYSLEEDEQQQRMQNLEQGYERYRQDWAGLMREYQSVPPPQECKALADTYYVALGNYIRFMMQIEQSLETQDLNTLLNMRGSAQAEVDQKLSDADVELARLCQEMGIRKSFRIGSSLPQNLFGF